MKRKDIRICIMRVGGTNCDEETRRVFDQLGVKAEVVHTRSIIEERNLLDYHGLVFPGGFAYGDYVRAGAIWADILRDELGDLLHKFVESLRPVLGICNGFQVLIETGLLPGFGGKDGSVEMALAGNRPMGYRCTWTTANDYLYLKHENSGKCVFTHMIERGKLLRMPIAHAEGRILLPKEKEQEYFRELVDGDQIVFRFARTDGNYASEVFPYNPNGSILDIAGICNRSGTVMGLMPHPERAFFGYQLPDWTQDKLPTYGDGRLIFESMINYILKSS
jgi:phosphoribosylformylglycinamidine synthase I